MTSVISIAIAVDNMFRTNDSNRCSNDVDVKAHDTGTGMGNVFVFVVKEGCAGKRKNRLSLFTRQIRVARPLPPSTVAWWYFSLFILDAHSSIHYARGRPVSHGAYGNSYSV